MSIFLISDACSFMCVCVCVCGKSHTVLGRFHPTSRDVTFREANVTYQKYTYTYVPGKLIKKFDNTVTTKYNLKNY